VTAATVTVDGAALGSVPIFARLSDSQLFRLASRTTVRTFAPGTVIVREGDTSMSLYVILSGGVRVDRSRAEGGAVRVAELGVREAFGEMGLIDDAPRSATVTAEAETTCALLAKWDFQNEIREDPEIAVALLPVLAQRIRAVNERLAREAPDA
jgi:CRP/FNR family transcriptional regulator, cyclic AMP receptor protein